MSAHVELYREDASEGIPGKWRWRFVSSGRITADSGQGYRRRIDAIRALTYMLGGRYDAICLNPVSGEDEGPCIQRVVWRDNRHGTERIPVRDLTRERVS